MRVSIVVPLFDKASTVERALDSIRAQTFGDFEVIVVDDGSTDGGGVAAAAYPDSRIRVVRQANSGPGGARNRGVAEARGELLAFLDADDEWLPQYLAESLRRLDDHGPDIASLTCGYFEHPAGASREAAWRARGLKDGVVRVSPADSPARVVAMLAYMSPCTTVVRAAAVRRWGGFFAADRCTYGEDAHLWLKVLMNEPVALWMTPLARLHFEASALSGNLPDARPVEPFLRDPRGVEASCPPPLRPLLARVLAIRAFKTACVLGYWGRWREARSLLRRFRIHGAWRLPYFAPALVLCTPFGAAVGAAWRFARDRSRHR